MKTPGDEVISDEDKVLVIHIFSHFFLIGSVGGVDIYSSSDIMIHKIIWSFAGGHSVMNLLCFRRYDIQM